MPVNLAMIARACGVSTSTVSLALRDHPRIPAATRMRIKTTAEQLGYTSNRSVSRVMSEIRTRGKYPSYKETLAYFTADVNQGKFHYEKRLYSGVVARAEEMGYSIDRFELGTKGLTMSQLPKILASRGIRGLILAPWPQAHSERELDWKDLASVAIGYTMESPDIHRVSRDVMHTLRGVFGRLKTQGYQRIGFVMERSHEARMEFMTLAAFQLNAFLSPESHRLSALVEDDLTEKSFNEWIIKQNPDVIITMQHQVLRWLLKAGRRVPEEIGVFFFNCKSAGSELSGIYPAYETLGAAAVEQVAALVERGEYGIPENATTLLVPGISCKGTTLRL